MKLQHSTTSQKVIDLGMNPDQHLPNHSMTNMNTYHGELLTSQEACTYLRVSMTTFIAYKNTELIRVTQQIGPKHFFSRKHLDNFLQIEPHVRNKLLADSRLTHLRRKRKGYDTEQQKVPH